MSMMTPVGGWNSQGMRPERYVLPEPRSTGGFFRIVLAFVAGVFLVAALAPRLHPVSRALTHRASASAGLHAQYRKPRRPLLSTEQEAEARKERRIAVRQLEDDERILHARSYTARAEAYCRSTMGSPASLAMAFSNGMSGDDAEVYYGNLLRTESSTREQEEIRQQELQATSGVVANYEGNVQECESMLLNGFEKMPSDEVLQIEIKSLESEILDIDTNGPEVAPVMSLGR